jgi:hypothetical protein
LNGKGYVTRLDALGHVLESALLPAAVTVSAIAVGSGGAVYLAGSVDSMQAFAARITFGGGSASPGALPFGRSIWATYANGGDAPGAAVDGQGNLHITGSGAAVDGQGNPYITGSADSSFTPTPGAAQPKFGGGVQNDSGKPTDAYVAALDPAGHMRWATFLGGSGNDHGYDIATDRQGNVYVLGETSSQDFPVTPGGARPQFDGAGTSATFLASYDGQGHQRWATTLATNDRMASDGQGNIYVIGAPYSTPPPTANPNAGTTPNSVVVSSYASDGRLRWSRSLEPTDPSDTFLETSMYSTNAIAVDRQGNIYLSGKGVASFDAAGRFRWETRLDLQSDQAINAIAVDGRGDVAVAGGSDYYGSYAGDNVVAVFDSTGHLRWADTTGGAQGQADRYNAVALDGHGMLYLTGVTASVHFPATPGAAQRALAGAENAFVIAYDVGTGHIRGASYLGGSGSDGGDAIAVDGQGKLYVTGYTTSPDFPGFTPGAQDVSDQYYAFVARVAAAPLSGAPS